MVQQNLTVINRSYEENIVLGLQDCPKSAIQEAAIMANADQFIT